MVVGAVLTGLWDTLVSPKAPHRTFGEGGTGTGDSLNVFKRAPSAIQAASSLKIYLLRNGLRIADVGPETHGLV